MMKIEQSSVSKYIFQPSEKRTHFTITKLLSTTTPTMSAPAAVTPAEPMFVQPKPYAFEAEPGKDYYYCTCGMLSDYLFAFSNDII